MKITTRIILGYGILIFLLAALVGYDVFTISRMQKINRNLDNLNFRTALSCMELMRERDLIDENLQKALLVDKAYNTNLQEFLKEFEKELEKVKSGSSSDGERTRIDQLADGWGRFRGDLENQPLGTANVKIFPEDLKADLEALHVQIESLWAASQDAIRNSVMESRRTGETALRFSYIAAAFTLVASVLVSFFIYRSISIPLVHLTEGTRAIAQGKFYYRLDTSRGDEFSQLAKDFNTMTLRLNELDDLKKAFISHVSHELKAPLASMRETIQLMLDGIPGPLTDKQRRLLELNLQSGVRLTSMIGNLLDLSRVDAGVMEYELKSRDLIPLVQDAVAELEGRAREKNLTVEPELPDQPVQVVCDGDRMIQVLVNLLGNAVKFSPAGGAIRVRLQTTNTLPSRIPQSFRQIIRQEWDGKEYALLSVADAGPGIPDCEKEQIFERFHQVKKAGKGTGKGVGLGLTICRTIVEAHGGAIWVEDNPPAGSVFRVLLHAGARADAIFHRASTPI